MSKNLKIAIAAISALIVVALIALAVVTFTGSSDETTTQVTNQTNENQEQTDDETDENTTTTIDQDDISVAIIGKWRDSINLSGYQFYSDSTVDITFAEFTLPILNIPIDGTVTGTYTLKGNKVTIMYSIYNQTFDETFTASVENNILTLIGGGETATYSLATEETQDTTENEIEYEDDELTGTWKNTDGSIEYTFDSQGLADIKISNQTYSGIYFIEEDQITIQYVKDDEIITLHYTYSVSASTMSLSDDESVTLWIRSTAS